MIKPAGTVLLLLILFLSLLLRVPFFSVPTDRDEGTYATVTKVVLDGGTPYKDVFTSRAPGIYYIYAFFIKVFGEKTEALRIGSAAFIIFKFACDLYGNGIGLLAALLYAIFSSGPLIQGSFANCEAFMMLPAVVATYLFYLGYKRQVSHYFLLAGIFSGVAYLVKEAALPKNIIRDTEHSAARSWRPFPFMKIPTKYFTEALLINFRRSVVYGLGVLGTVVKFRIQKIGIGTFPIFGGRNGGR